MIPWAISQNRSAPISDRLAQEVTCCLKCPSSRKKGSFFSLSADEFVAHGTVLAQVASLLLHTWNAIGANPDNRHLGPMAQDFYIASAD